MKKDTNFKIKVKKIIMGLDKKDTCVFGILSNDPEEFKGDCSIGGGECRIIINPTFKKCIYY